MNQVEMAVDLGYVKTVSSLQYRQKMADIKRPRPETRPKQRIISDSRALNKTQILAYIHFLHASLQYISRTEHTFEAIKLVTFYKSITFMYSKYYNFRILNRNSYYVCHVIFIRQNNYPIMLSIPPLRPYQCCQSLFTIVKAQNLTGQLAHLDSY